MRKLFTIALALGLAMAMTTFGWAECMTIQDGTIYHGRVGDPDLTIVSIGYDEFGYNYQAHMFNGRYCDNDRVEGGPSCDVDLMMKWSDTWLSNKDCNEADEKLDRGFICDQANASSSACPGAWLTNHQSGKVEVDGRMRKWTYFVKIVAVPDDAVKVDGFWKTADGIEIGPEIWGAYARIQQVSNDPSAGEHGILYKSPAGPGFGIYAE